jgi:hypothetical protein
MVEFLQEVYLSFRERATKAAVEKYLVPPDGHLSVESNDHVREAILNSRNYNKQKTSCPAFCDRIAAFHTYGIIVTVGGAHCWTN